MGLGRAGESFCKAIRNVPQTRRKSRQSLELNVGIYRPPSARVLSELLNRLCSQVNLTIVDFVRQEFCNSGTSAQTEHDAAVKVSIRGIPCGGGRPRFALHPYFGISLLVVFSNYYCFVRAIYVSLSLSFRSCSISQFLYLSISRCNYLRTYLSEIMTKKLPNHYQGAAPDKKLLDLSCPRGEAAHQGFEAPAAQKASAIFTRMTRSLIDPHSSQGALWSLPSISLAWPPFLGCGTEPLKWLYTRLWVPVYASNVYLLLKPIHTSCVLQHGGGVFCSAKPLSGLTFNALAFKPLSCWPPAGFPLRTQVCTRVSHAFQFRSKLGGGACKVEHLLKSL